MRRSALALALSLTLSGCFHATVTTGTPAPQAAPESRTFASSWLWGLVPPATINPTCPRGLARVETQVSVPNRLVSWLTAGIYTPMSIVVTCAAEQ